MQVRCEALWIACGQTGPSVTSNRASLRWLLVPSDSPPRIPDKGMTVPLCVACFHAYTRKHAVPVAVTGIPAQAEPVVTRDQVQPALQVQHHLLRRTTFSGSSRSSIHFHGSAMDIESHSAANAPAGLEDPADHHHAGEGEDADCEETDEDGDVGITIE